MIEDVNIPEALDVKEQLSEIDGVSGVTWLDDVIDIKIPLELIDNDILETYYKNDNALFTFEVEEGKEVEATDAIYEIIGEDNALAGDARSEEHTSELQSRGHLVCRLLLEKKQA